MTSALYAVLSAVLIIRLSLLVVRIRRRERVSIGDGNNEALRLAIAAQHNAVEYIPIALLLLFAVELDGAPQWLLHVLGIALLTGRLIHARALMAGDLRRRVLGMQITVYTILALVIANLAYLPYPKVFAL